MWREILKGIIQGSEAVYKAEDDRRYMGQLSKDLGVDKIADSIASRTGLAPTITVERRNRNLNSQLFGYGKADDTEFITKVSIPVKQKNGRVMVDDYRYTGYFDGGFDGVPLRRAVEVVGTKPSKKQPLTDTVEIIVREGGGRVGQAEVEVVAKKFAPVDRGALHRKVFEEVLKSDSIIRVALSGIDKHKVLAKVTEVLKDFNK